jgi:hypothetical protein
MDTPEHGEKVENNTYDQEFHVSNLVEVTVYDTSNNKVNVDFRNETEVPCIWITVDFECPTNNMTCPNRGQYRPETGETGWLWLDEYVQLNELEILEATSEKTFSEVEEFDLAAKYWDEDSQTWSKEGLN